MSIARWQHTAGACGILSASFFVAADVTGTALRPDYSVIGQAISELIERGAPNKALLDGLLLGFHGLVIPFALGLGRSLRPRRLGWLGPTLLAVAGALGVILTLLFPCDPGCQPITARGTAHIFIAVPMGISVVLSIAAFGWRFAGDAAWASLSHYSYATSAAGLVLAAMTVALAETGVVGLFERILTASYLQWYVVVGLTLVRGRARTPARGRPRRRPD